MSKQYLNVFRNKGKLLIRELINNSESRRTLYFHPIMYHSVPETTKLKNFYQNGYVKEVTYPSVFEMNKDIEMYKDIPNQIWGNPDIVMQYLYEEKYDTSDTSKINISYLDIEVCTRYQNEKGEWVDGGFPSAQQAAYPINAICDYRSNKKKYYCFTTAKGWTKELSKLQYKDEVEYIYCSSEKELLEKWLAFWMNDYPHVVTGWNCKTFDIPYIVNRYNVVYGNTEMSQKLSPWGIISAKTIKSMYGDDQSTYTIAGISCMDYLDLYKKYRNTPREKYTLGYISSCENPNEHKLEFKGTHGSLYYDDPSFFVDYNIQDVRCVVNFERDLQFINLACYIAYFANENFEDVFSPIKTWETLIYNKSLENNIVMPLKEHQKRESYEGAYVHTPVPGLKGCVVSFDFASLYPSIFRQWYCGADVMQKNKEYNALYNGLLEVLENSNNPKCKEMLKEIKLTGIMNEFYIHNDIPEEVTQYLKEHNVSMTSNIQFFDVSKKSEIIELISTLYKERKADKKTSFNHKHKAQDIASELEKRGIKV